MAKKFDYMPFYGAAFYTDNRVQQMSLAQEAMYLRLLWHDFTHGGICPPLPGCDELMQWASIVGCAQSDPEYSQFAGWVPVLFPQERDGWRRNPKAKEVRNRQLAIYESRAEAGRGSAKKRVANILDGDRTVTAQSARAMPTHKAEAEAEGSTATATAATRAREANLDYVIRCIGALHAGLRVNLKLVGYRELPASTQVGVVTWAEDGIPVELAERVIEERAALYVPKPGSPQPNGLRYFDGAVREAWTKTQPSENPFAALLREKTTNATG